MKLAKKIEKRTALSLQVIRKMLKQEYFSIGQLSLMTGLPASNIHNMSRPNIKKTSRLNRVYPFPVGKNPESGQVFIKNDAKSIALLIASNT